MRVTHKVFFFPEILSLDELDDVVAEQSVKQEPIAEAFNNIIFRFIPAGLERAVIILRAEGMSYEEISWILGLEKIKVHRMFYKIRDRLVKADVKKYLKNPITQHCTNQNNLTKGL